MLIHPTFIVNSAWLEHYLLPEVLLNGMVITVLIGLRSDWLKTYDDELYLKG